MKPRFLLVLCLLPAAPVWAVKNTEVTLVVDMTPAGRKVVHPTPEHPAYYLAALSDYMESGGSYAQRDPAPPETDIAHWVAVALADQGYLVAHPQLRVNSRHELTYADGTVITVPYRPRMDRPLRLTGYGDPLTVDMIKSKSGPYSYNLPREIRPGVLSPFVQILKTVDPVHGAVMAGMPSIAIAIRWGAVHPGDVNFDPGNAPPLRFNLGPMLSLIAGDNFDGLSHWDQEDVMARTGTDRYFIAIAAYDFLPWLREHKQLLLWEAKMTVPSNGSVTLADMLPLMISTGEARFGRESGPEFTGVTVRPGRVILGTPEVKEDNPAPAP